MFLFRFIWWLTWGVVRLGVTVGVALYLFVTAEDGLDSLQARTVGWVAELKAVDYQQVWYSAEEALLDFLKKRQVQRTAERSLTARRSRLPTGNSFRADS